MGAVINNEPELANVVVMKVPFVDVINTMLDTSIPLTVTEFEEWGNPEDEAYFKYMREYSPYDNIDKPENQSKKYPSILVTSGLNDSRVQYWEPTKFVAALRYFYETKNQKGANKLLLKTNMGAGHAGASGRYERWREDAEIAAFIFDNLNIKE